MVPRAARLRLVVPALVIFLAFSVATTAGTVIFLGGTRSFLVLAATLSGLCSTAKGFPPALLAVAAAVLLVPFLFLAALSAGIAFLLLALLLAAPFAFSLLDR